MFDSLKNIVLAFKEGAVEAGAKAFINRKIESFGEVTHLQIDPRGKIILLQATLKGETSPVVVKVLRYEVISAPEATYLQLGEFDASREWITAVLNQYVTGLRLPVPASVQALL